MRKNIRRIFSIILAAILLLCASLPVFAKSEKCSCGTPPRNLRRGLGQREALS